MMREIAIRDVEVAAIRTSAGFAQRLQDEGVVRMAQSVRIAGLVYPPCVRGADMRLVCGEDRVAAHVILGEKTIRCKLVECSDSELDVTRRIETAYRRHDAVEQAASLTELLDLVEQEVSIEWLATPKPKGSKLTARGEARRRIGAAIGKSEAALAQHDSRQRRFLGPKEKPAKEVWQLDGYGFDVPAPVQARAKAVKDAMEAADDYGRRIQRTVTMVADVYSPVATVHELARRAAAVSRSLVPSHLCPWCKAHSTAMPLCGGCSGHGFVSEKDFEAAAGILRESRVICYAGQHVSYDTFRNIDEERDTIPAPASFVSEDSFEFEEEPPAAYGEEEF